MDNGALRFVHTVDLSWSLIFSVMPRPTSRICIYFHRQSDLVGDEMMSYTASLERAVP